MAYQETPQTLISICVTWVNVAMFHAKRSSRFPSFKSILSKHALYAPRLTLLYHPAWGLRNQRETNFRYQLSRSFFPENVQAAQHIAFFMTTKSKLGDSCSAANKLFKDWVSPTNIWITIMEFKWVRSPLWRFHSCIELQPPTDLWLHPGEVAEIDFKWAMFRASIVEVAEWSCKVVDPLFKKGDRRVCPNDRGIILQCSNGPAQHTQQGPGRCMDWDMAFNSVPGGKKDPLIWAFGPCSNDGWTLVRLPFVTDVVHNV